MNYSEIEKIAKEQEEKLVFEHFSNKDAWELGQFMVNRLYEKNITLAVSIRKLNGAVIFQHLPDGTNLLNQVWMNRKFNTVSMNERSSFGYWAELNAQGISLTDVSLEASEYALGGGGFPVRLKTGEIVAVIITSNLPHEKDHAFIVETLKEWLDKQDVPEITF